MTEPINLTTDHRDICPSCEAIDTVAIAHRSWTCTNCGATGWIQLVEDDEDAL